MSSTRRRLRRALCLLMIAAMAMQAAAAELVSIEVSEEDGRYRLVSEALFAAGRDELYAVLSDFELHKKFTSVIIESRNLEADAEGRPRFFTRMKGCVLFYCQTFVRNGYLLLTPKHDIVAVSDPEESDFEYCRERWRLRPEEGGTVMTYEFEMDPRFWVPPLIGPYMIKRTLRSGGVRAINRIEALARGEEPVL